MFSGNRGGAPGRRRSAGSAVIQQPRPLQGAACLQKQSLSQPSVRYAEIRFLYCSKGPVIAIRVCVSSQSDEIKGRGGVLLNLSRASSGGN